MRILLQNGINWALCDTDAHSITKTYTAHDLLAKRKNKETVAEELDLLDNMKMFTSYDHYNSLRESQAGKAVLTAFWKYVDGNVFSLGRIFQGNPQKPIGENSLYVYSSSCEWSFANACRTQL
jgi:hypothetical protein